MKSLEELRKEIDKLDEGLLHILVKRIDIVRQIGELKKLQGLSPLDEKRRDEIIESVFTKAALLNVPKHFIKKLYTLIHDYSVELQKKI